MITAEYTLDILPLHLLEPATRQFYPYFPAFEPIAA
jgi:hypothetical protein